MSWSSGWGPSASANDASSAAPRPPRLQGRYDNDNNGSATSSQSPSRSEAVFLNNSRRPSPDRRAMGRGGGNAATTTGLTSSTAEPLMDPTAMPPPPPLMQRNGGWPSNGGGGAFHTPHPQNYQQHQQLQRGPPYPTAGYAVDPSSMSIGGGGGGSSMLYNPPPAAAGSSIDLTWGADVTRAHHHHHLHHHHQHHHYAHSSQATNNTLGTPGLGDAPWWDGRRHEGLKADNAPSNRQQWPEGPSSTRLQAQHDRDGGGQLQPGRDEQQQQQQQQQLEHQVYELHQGLLKYRAALQDERRRREAAEARVKELEQRIHLLLATSVAEQQAQLLRGSTATSQPAPAMTPRNGIINGYGGPGVVNSSSAGLLSVPSLGAVGVTDTPSSLHNVNAAAWAPQQQQQMQFQQQHHQAQLQLMARLDILESQNELLRQRLYENGGQGNGGGGTMATTQKGGGAAGGGGGGAQS